MLSLNPRSLPRSPIHEVPYDVLREIFHHCLPRYPLETRQPNTTVAPMLLCQICSSWRMIALASPSLWSHLSFCFTTMLDDLRRPLIYLQKESDFIMWWKRNQGSIAPFLRLEIEVAEYANEELSLTEDGLAVLMNYMTSAQYIQVDTIFAQWGPTVGELAIGGNILLPNLHTLATCWPKHDKGYSFYTVKGLAKLALRHTPSFLRGLSVNGAEVPLKTIPTQWSGLTHLSMGDLNITLDFWFSLIRTVTNLQWAYFCFDGIYRIQQYTEPAAQYTLPHLSTLFFNYNFERAEYVDLPLSLLFSALYLPTLHTLSLSSATESWTDERAIHELYTVLRSTLAITTLTLRGREFLSLGDGDFFPSSLTVIGDVEPIWNHSPHLMHLQIELPKVNCARDIAGEILDTFVHNIFLSTCSWLGLDNAACPIKSITFIATKIECQWGPSFEDVRDLTMASIQKRDTGMSNIVFKVISHLEDDTGAEVWKEWGLRSPS